MTKAETVKAINAEVAKAGNLCEARAVLVDGKIRYSAVERGYRQRRTFSEMVAYMNGADFRSIRQARAS